CWQIESLRNLVTGVQKPPFLGELNSVYDFFKDGKLEQRRYYGSTGKPRLDIDYSNHGNPKQHPVVPHAHTWNSYEKNKVGVKREKVWRELTKAEKLVNDRRG